MKTNFSVKKNCPKTNARLGRLETAHADVETPIFMPVGTHAAVRSQRMGDIKELGFQMLLANTYHLILRPGPEYFKNCGGIRPFSNWPHGFLTDSGGFQIFSLANARRISEAGAVFKNHINGDEVFLSPESSIEAQKAFQSDIMMVLDECVPSTTTHDDAARAMQLTHRWAKRSLDARGNSTQGLFGIVQGACFEDLRIQSAQHLTEYPFDGFAIGGLAVGEGNDEREAMTALVTKHLPVDKPRYLMGVGTPYDILEAVSRGIDMFDCVLPTMLGQQGVAFHWQGKMDLRKAVFFDDPEPIEKQCTCYTCMHFSRAYLHHLIKTYDISAASYIGLHNITFYGELMQRIRYALIEGTFEEYYVRTRKEFLLMSHSSVDAEETPKSKVFSAPVDGSEYEVLERKNRENKYVVSIRHLASGEVMHSSEDPYRESNTLYVAQAKIDERLSNRSALTIWDVGLGAATNAHGALARWEKLKDSNLKTADLTIESFEITLEPLTLVLGQKTKFPHAQHPYVQRIATEKSVQADGLTWNLYLGDFLANIGKPKLPDLIYYDPFSYKVDSPLWTVEAFTKLYSVLGNHPAVAFTFSAATRVRAALLSVGFYVAYGSATGKKTETTIFMTPSAAAHETYSLLDARWLSRWERSHTKFPENILPIEEDSFSKKIRSHPQFKQNTVSS